MISLATAGTLQGSAGTGTAITYTVTGMEIASGVEAYKVLGQGQLGTSAAPLYTVPGATTALVREIFLANTMASPIIVALYVNGTTAANKIVTVTIPASGSASYDGWWKVYDASGYQQYVGSTGPTGARGATYRGAWSGATAYVLDDVVSNGGSSWISIQAGTNHTPPTLPTTSDSWWSALSIKGDQGIQGIQGITGEVPNARTLTAGAGQTGGGDLSANRTFNVVANADGSMVVNADDVQVGVLATDAQHGVRGGGTLHANAVAAGAAGFLSGADKTKLDATSGANTGDQTIALSGDSTGTGVGAITVVNTRLQGIPVSSTVPGVGTVMAYGTASWGPVENFWNVVSFGADPTANTPSTVAIYNAILSCGIATNASYLVTSGTPTTSTSSFNVTVTANAAFPSSGTGTLMAMTTRGLVFMTFSGGTTTTVACTVVAGVAGGTILAGSFMGIASTTQVGGTVFFPPGLYLTDQEITNSIPGVHFVGAAAGANADVGNWGYAGGSWLFYNGPAGGTILRNAPLSGTAGLQGGQNLKGIKVVDINFAASGTSWGYGYAGIGLSMISCHGYYLENLFVNEPAFVAYEFTTMGATMLGEAADTTRGIASNLRFRLLATPAATAAQVSAAATAITAGVGTNINTFTGTGTISTAALTAAAWPMVGGIGLAMVQGIDQLTGNVMDYLVSYTGVSGPGLTGVTTLSLWWNQANATTLAASAPATGNPKPNALLFTGALVRPAYAAYAMGIRLHGSATANSSVNTFIQCGGNHWMNAAAYLGNSDSNRFVGLVWNRTSAGTPTGIGWDVQGATAIVGPTGTSRNNVWLGGDAGPGGVNLRGTNSYGYTAAALPNYWILYELGNGAPVPVVGTGAFFQGTYNGAVLPGGIGSPATAAQALTVSVQNVLTGSSIQIPPLGVVAGFTWFRWTIGVRKTTVAGAATWTAKVCFGTANTNADTAIATFTSGTNTAIVDSGVLIIDCVVLTGGAAATAGCSCVYTHNPGVVATGLGDVPSIPGATATFNAGLANPGPSYFHVDVTPGAAAVMTATCNAQVMR